MNSDNPNARDNLNILETTGVPPVPPEAHQRAALWKVSGIHRNRLGTITFQGQFAGMRKAQEFDCYPVKAQDARVVIQSDTRIGWITMDGAVFLCRPKAGGAYFPDLAQASRVDQLTGEALQLTGLAFSPSVAGGDTGAAVVTVAAATPYVVVECPGQESQHEVAEFSTATAGRAYVQRHPGCDLMRRCADGSLTTEF